MSRFENIDFDVDEGIGLVRFNRPKRLNALSAGLIGDLRTVIEEARLDDGLRALVLTGDDRAFSSGADLKEKTPDRWGEIVNSTFNRLENLPKPTIAAIRGWCLAGGLELAMACDLRVAGANAKIGDWHVKINSIGGGGATVRLVRLIGLSRAKELVYTGAAVDGEEAMRLGLANRVCADEECVDVALALARELAAHNPVTLRQSKRALHAAVDLDLYQALEYSLELQDELVRTLDADYGATFEERQQERTKASG